MQSSGYFTPSSSPPTSSPQSGYRSQQCMPQLSPDLCYHTGVSGCPNSMHTTNQNNHVYGAPGYADHCVAPQFSGVENDTTGLYDTTMHSEDGYYTTSLSQPQYVPQPYGWSVTQGSLYNRVPESSLLPQISPGPSPSNVVDNLNTWPQGSGTWNGPQPQNTYYRTFPTPAQNFQSQNSSFSTANARWHGASNNTRAGPNVAPNPTPAPHPSLKIQCKVKDCYQYLVKAAMGRHVKHCHRGQKAICYICWKFLSRQDSLTRHVRTLHPEDFPQFSADRELLGRRGRHAAQ